VKQPRGEDRTQLVAEHSINLPYITVNADKNPLFLDEHLTARKKRFQKITQDLLDRTRKPVQSVIKDAGISVWRDRPRGAGGVPPAARVSELVKEMTGGQEPNKGATPMRSSVGAALQAGVSRARSRTCLLLDVTPLSFASRPRCVMTKLIERNTHIPTTGRRPSPRPTTTIRRADPGLSG